MWHADVSICRQSERHERVGTATMLSLAKRGRQGGADDGFAPDDADTPLEHRRALVLEGIAKLEQGIRKIDEELAELKRERDSLQPVAAGAAAAVVVVFDAVAAGKVAARVTG